MKKSNNINYLLKRYLLITLTLFILSCEDDNTIEYDKSASIFQKVTDPFIQVKTPVVGFQAGTESYELGLNVINGTKALTEVKAYSIFTDAESGLQSNEVLLSTFPVAQPNRTLVTSNIDYEQLKSGLTVNGAALPEAEVDLKVGSGWVLRFEGTTTTGETIPLAGNINVAVLSRFAGIYKVLEGTYQRFDGITADYTGQERFIGSVNENTFSYNDYWGSFAWTGNQFNFTIDFVTNEIYGPILVDGLFSGTEALRCGESAFGIFPCAGSNVLIPDDVTGKHKIILTYGYIGAGGNREFYEELEKVVE